MPVPMPAPFRCRINPSRCCGADHIQVIHGARPGWFVRTDDSVIARGAGDYIRPPARGAACSNPANAAVSSGAGQPESRPAARYSLPRRDSTCRLAVVAQHLQLRSHFAVVVVTAAPAFPTCSQVLAGIETERRGAAHRTGLHPSVRPCEKYSAPCAWQASSITIRPYAIGQVQDRIHIRHLPV